MITTTAEEPGEKDIHHVWRRVARWLLAALPARAQDDDREGHREIPPDAQGGSVEQSRIARRRPRRGALEDAGRPEQGLAREMRSRQGRRRGRWRVRRIAALFRRRQQGDGPRNPPDVVHGEAPGRQARRPGQEAVSGRRAAGEGPRRDRHLCRQQVERHEVCRQARPAAGEGRGRRRARHLLPPPGPARFRLRHLPQRFRQAHPAAGPAVSSPTRRRPSRSSASGRPIASRPRR